MELTTLPETLSEEMNHHTYCLPDLLEDVPVATQVWREGIDECGIGWVLFKTLNKDLLALMVTSLREIDHGLTSRQEFDFVKFLRGHVDELSCKVMEYLDEEASKMDDDVVFFLEDLQPANVQTLPN